jgi:hypothetical protein
MGMSKPYFRHQGMAVNRFVYRDEILEPFLLPFIKNIINMISMYSGQIRRVHIMPRRFRIGYFPKKIEFLPKIINPANAPKLRPIEDFWGILKTNVYENNWSAKKVSQLKKNSALPKKNGLKPFTENCWDGPKKIGHCP